MRVITYKTLHTIDFPIYSLRYAQNLAIEDNLLKSGDKVVDDYTVPGRTLGTRRLLSKENLFPLKIGYTTLDALLQERETNTIFIDNKGWVFKYLKTKYGRVKHLKILKVILKDTCSILKIHGVHSPIKVPRPPNPGVKWAAILFIGRMPLGLYSYSEEWQPPLKRKI